MTGRNRELFNSLSSRIMEFHDRHEPLPGILHDQQLDVFVYQIIDSIRRVEFASQIGSRNDSHRRMDPNDEMFDPLKAAKLHFSDGNIDEACWLVFLATHCGKHAIDGWKLSRDIYGMSGKNIMSWEWACNNQYYIEQWMSDHFDRSSTGRFGNHRKYETLDSSSRVSTANVLQSYIKWVQREGGHEALIQNASINTGGNPRSMFRWLYNNMDVLRFGRTGKFDFLTMLAKLGIVNIEADSTYLWEASGPLDGARLLFFGSKNSSLNTLSSRELDQKLIQLADFLGIGMQEMEDSLCNWQKNPNRYNHFRG
nr:hypothetical protein [Oceanospirillum sediminis]